MGGLEEVLRSNLLPRWATQHYVLVNKSVKLFIKYGLFHPVTQCAQTQRFLLQGEPQNSRFLLLELLENLLLICHLLVRCFHCILSCPISSLLADPLPACLWCNSMKTKVCLTSSSLPFAGLKKPNFYGVLW